MREREEVKIFFGQFSAGFKEKKLEKLIGLYKPKEYKKGSFFLKKNTNALYFGLVVDGALREYYTDDNGREHNKAFCFKGDLTGSYYDLVSGNRSTVSIQALVDSKVLIIKYAEFEKLINSDTHWLHVAYKFLQHLLLKKAEKEYQLLTLTAKKRYELMQKEQPELEQLVPAYHIASYLGITPISLSRIRAQRKR